MNCNIYFFTYFSKEITFYFFLISFFLHLQKKIMFENLKSLFFVSVEEQNNPSSETPPNSEPINKDNSTKGTTVASQGSVDNTILNKLFQAIEDNNQPGFDYLEFRKALLTLADYPMDEATKFQSTFATAATIGITLEKLIESIDFYKKVLLNEEDNFTKAIKEQTSINIDEKRLEKEKLSNTIKEKSDRIQKLTEEIRSHQSEILHITTSIENSELKIKETSMNFKTSLNVIKNQLEQDAIKLKQYIK